MPLHFPQSEGSQSVFHPPADDLEVIFAEAFSALQGRFVYCGNEADMQHQLLQLLQQRRWHEVYCTDPLLIAKLPRVGFSAQPLSHAEAVITGCELLIARTGTVVISTGQPDGRTTSVYAPVHICIARVDQLVYDIKDGLLWLRKKYDGKLPSLITLATGPSRTTAIENRPVVGVHGPKEVFVFLTEN